MNEKIDRILEKLSVIKMGANPYIAFGATFLALHIFTDFTVDGFFSQSFRLIILFSVFCAVVFGAWLYLNDRLTSERASILIIIIGVLVRISYIFCTDVYARQHDIYEGDDTGHIGYILHIVKNAALPDTNLHQLYHPPLHYFISAALYWINGIFKMGEKRNLESLQFLTAFYSSCLTALSYRILKKLNISGKFLTAATIIIALHPALFILAGSVNNDVLCVALSVASALFLIEWNEDQSVKNTVKFAACVGLAVMTKAGAATLAFVIAPFFIAKLFANGKFANGKIEKGKFSPRFKIASKLALFGLISLPIGLWHPIRNLKAFGQPFGYVLQLNAEGPLYVGGYSFVKRMLSFPLSQIFVRLYPDPFEDYNIPVYTLKSSLFGEWSYNDGLRAIAVALIILNFILIIASLASAVYAIIKLRRDGVWELFLFWLVQIAAFAFFNIKFPFGATMDFRYIVPTYICGAGFIGMTAESLSKEFPKLWIKAERPIFAVCAFFGLFSVLFYLFI